jgi:cytochrome c oxidase assembly protein Cox11
MPVVFVIEKALPVDVNFVTLSYTFFQVEGRAGSAG